MLFVFTEWGDTIEQLQQVQLTNNHVNDGRNQMKKLSVFSMIAICIFLINSFTTFAERAYPPGESYSVEKITTDSYPNMRLRSQNAEGSWQQDDTGWWWQYPDGSYAINKWEYIDGRWYFFNQDGYMLQGWQNINGEWFYLETTGNSTFPAGAMVTGWYEINNYWYYFYSTAQYEHTAGAMAIGWLNMMDIAITYIWSRQVIIHKVLWRQDGLILVENYFIWTRQQDVLLQMNPLQ